MTGARAREPVGIDVGDPCRTGVVVGRDKVRVDLSTNPTRFFVTADDGLRETFALSLGIRCLWNEGRRIDAVDEPKG